MSKIYKISFCIAFILFSINSLKAQDNVAYDYYSPYSMFCLGNIELEGNQNTLAMGGIGIADRNISNINLLNPAGVTAREDKAFMLDFGLAQKNILYQKLTSGGDKLNGMNNLANIHHIAVSFPIYKHSAFKLGIMPYSSTGYDIMIKENRDDIIVNHGDVVYTKSGKGGVYQLFAGAGVTLFDRLSIGADIIYHIGNIYRNSSTGFTAFSSNSDYRSYSRSWNHVVRGFSGKGGLQYEQPLGKDINLTLGATYRLGANVGGEYHDATVAISSSTDTIKNIRTSLYYEIPAEYGAGFTLRKADKWMFGADYIRQDWSSMSFSETYGKSGLVTTSLSQTFKVGMEFIPNKYDIRYYFKRVTYRLGAYYKQGYLSVAGHQINNEGITFGIGLPIYNRNNAISVAVDIGQAGTLENSLIRERYMKFTVGINLFDIWFLKSLYN